MQIDFSKLKAQKFTTAAVEARAQEIAADRDTSKFFNPGEYEVFVTQVEYLGAARNDATWLNVRIHLKGIKDKTAKALVMVPTDDIVYGEHRIIEPWKRFSSLAQALGLEGRAETVGNDADLMFGDAGSRLIGARLKVQIGYKDNYAERYQTPEGTWGYRLRNSKGQPFLRDGKEVTFPDVAALNEFRQVSKNLRIQSFPEVLTYSVSATPTLLNSPVLLNF